MKNWVILGTCCLVAVLTVSPALAQTTNDKGYPIMAIEENKQLVLRLFNEVFNERKLPVIDELYAEDVVDHSAFPDQEPGRAGINSAISGFFEAFDSLHIVVEDVIAEGDKVVTRETWKAVDGSSHETATGTIIHIFRVQDGRITDEWSRGWDWLG